MTDPDADADESKIERLEKRIAELEKRQSRSALSRRSILAGVLGVGGLAAMGNVSAQQNQVGTIGTQNKRVDLLADEIDANSLSGSVKNQGCRVFLSSNQSISQGTRVKIRFDSEVYDSDGNFDTSTHNWTCPETGLYIVNLNVNFGEGGTDELRTVGIGTASNASPNSTGIEGQNRNSDKNERLSVSTINKYTQGDTIAGYAANFDQSDELGRSASSNGTFLEVAFLGGL